MNKIRGLFKRRGRWYYQASSKGLPKGSPRPEEIDLETSDEEDARLKLARMRENGKLSLHGGNLGFDYWADAYLEDMRKQKKHRDTTRDEHLCTHDYWTTIYGDNDPKRVTKDQALDFYALMVGSKAQATAHKHIRNMRAMFSWLDEKNVILKNPFSKLGIPTPTGTKREKFLSAKDRDRVIAEAKLRDPELYYIAVLGFHAGLRIGEIIESRGEWFRLDSSGRGFMMVSKTENWEAKTGNSERMIPLSDPVLKMLEEVYDNTMPDGYMLAPDVEKGRGKYRYNPRFRWRDMFTDLKLEAYTGYHVTRHTFGSLHAMAGTPDKKVIRWMGITPKTFDKHYAGLSPNDDDINNV